MEDLSGRVAVVTGAASGIGAGIARACAEQGMRVVLADIELAPASGSRASSATAGTPALAVRTDVTRAADLEALADAAFEHFGSRRRAVQQRGRRAGRRDPRVQPRATGNGCSA